MRFFNQHRHFISLIIREINVSFKTVHAKASSRREPKLRRKNATI